MKRTISLPRIAAVSLLFEALAAGLLAFTSSRSAIGSPGYAISPGPLGVVETDGTLDSSFNAGRITNGVVFAATLQPDGKLLIGGQFSEVHGVVRHGLARLNVDGTLDLSFGGGAGSDNGVGGIAVLPDGKILISEFFSRYDGVSRIAIARLNGSDGSLDLSFNPGRGISRDGLDDGSGNATFPGTLLDVVLEPDGKMIVFGEFSFIITGPGTSVSRSCVARFNSDGTFDPTYNPGAGATISGGIFPPHMYNTARQALGANAGKMVVQGYFDSFDGHPAPGFVRLNADGSFDDTFTPGSGANGPVYGLRAQSDDRILVVGKFSSFNGVARNSIVRLESSGLVDNGFAPAFEWYGVLPDILYVTQQPDDKLIVTGTFHSLGGVTANNVVRLEINGAMDASFSSIGTGPSGYRAQIALVRPSDGKIFFGGYFSTFGDQVRHNMAWTNADGSIDNTFAGLGGATEYAPNVWALATQTDGKIVVTGLFNSANGVPHNNVLRVNTDGTIDASFDAHTDRSTRALLIQPDGKILISGDFREVNGVPLSRIARLNSDGTLDPTFDPGTGADEFIYALAQDSAGNIYAGGLFSNFNDLPRMGLVKLSANGAVDPAFNSGGGGAFPVFAIASPGDGGIVIGGAFTTYNGTAARRIARVDTTTGAIDPTFQAGTGSGFSGTVNALQVAPDGKYYAGGNFISFNGVSRRRVARLNNDGTLDFDFEDPQLEGVIYSLALQNGKVYAGGTNPPTRLTRLTSSGALDPSFVTGAGFEIVPVNNYTNQFPTKISALGIQADGKLLVGGIFNRYNGTARSCLARLTGPLTPPTPTPTSTPSPATPTPTPTPTLTPIPTATPSPSPGRALNISTRMLVQTGDGVGIGGFIITGSVPKLVTVRGIGPSLAGLGVPNPLADPILELHGPSGFATLTNDNWTDSQEQCLATPDLRPTDPLESALCGLNLEPGAYTAIVRGKNNGTGIGLVEVYDLGPEASKLANISTRAFVGTGANVMIGGFILGGGADSHIAILGIGPSLAASGVGGVLADPTLELRDSSGALVASNDNCGAVSIHPLDPAEACIDISLPPGLFTAIMAGKNGGTGIGLLEIYHLQ
jgi:uncharacterized delta-60 repeat protein